MASALAKQYKEDCLSSAAPDLTTVNVKLVLLDTADYTFNVAHDFLDDVAAGREETSGNFGSKTIDVPEGGVFDAADVTLSAATGDPCEALWIYNDTPGTEATKNLIAYIDGFSVTLNGGDVVVQWAGDPNRIFKL